MIFSHWKTYLEDAALACAFANQACRQGYGARYIRLPKLFQAISIAKADGSSLGDAILDRLIHNSHRIEVTGPSMREIIAVKIHKKEIL